MDDAQWQNECSTIKERDVQLLEKGFWSDCSFEVGDTKEIFYTHKIYFAKTSAVFAAMFFGNMPESTDKAIKLGDIQANIFKILLKYVYTNEIDLKSYADAGDLIYVAKKYMFDKLLKACKDYLLKNLSPLNALKLYELGKFYEEQELLNASLEVIRKETCSVFHSPDFVNINLSVMEDILEQEILETTEIEQFKSLETLAQLKGLMDVPRQELSNDVSSNKTKQDLTSSKKKKLFDEFRNAAKKIKYLSMTASDFADGPCFSKLILPEDALAILACLINKRDIEKRYPVGFSQTKRQLTTIPCETFKISDPNMETYYVFN